MADDATNADATAAQTDAGVGVSVGAGADASAQSPPSPTTVFELVITNVWREGQTEESVTAMLKTVAAQAMQFPGVVAFQYGMDVANKKNILAEIYESADVCAAFNAAGKKAGLVGKLLDTIKTTALQCCGPKAQVDTMACGLQRTAHAVAPTAARIPSLNSTSHIGGRPLLPSLAIARKAAGLADFNPGKYYTDAVGASFKGFSAANADMAVETAEAAESAAAADVAADLTPDAIQQKLQQGELEIEKLRGQLRQRETAEAEANKQQQLQQQQQVRMSARIRGTVPTQEAAA